MKVVLVGTAHPLRGAMAQLNAILGHRLAERHDVEVVTFKRQYPEFLFPGKTQLDPSNPLFELPTRILIDSINPLSWYTAARHIISRKPDVLIFRYWIPFLAPCFGVIARCVKKRTGAGILFICDNVVPHERRIGDRALTRFALRSADAFIVQSKTVEADLLSLIPHARYRLVPHPLYDVFGEPLPMEEARAQLGLSPQDRVLLFFGYIRKYKGLDVLLHAVSILQTRLPLRLLVVGEFYEDASRYHTLIRELGLGSSVVLRSGYVPNEEIPLYFSACDAVALPYRSATQSGIVPLAYRYDKPVIASDVGGLSEVVKEGKTGYLVPPGEPERLAEAILRFYEEGRRELLTANVRNEKTKYRWENFVTVVEEVMEMLRREGGGGSR